MLRALGSSITAILFASACALPADEVQATTETEVQVPKQDTVSPIPSRPMVAEPPESGLIRPGGPVNRPVPGTGTLEWPALGEADIVGVWELRAASGFALCEISFSAAQSDNTRPVAFAGACPDRLKRAAYWRYFADLNQIALLGTGGQMTDRLRRTGATSFMIHVVGIGSLTLVPKP